MRSGSFIGLVIAAFYLVSPLMYLLRVTIGDEGITSVLLRLMQPTLLLVLLFWIISHRIRADVFSIFLSALYTYGILQGLISGFSPIDVMSGSVHYIQGLLIYIWAINNPNLEEIFLRLLRRLWKYYLPILTLAISYLYISNFALGANFYIGVATQALIPLYFWSLAKQRGAKGALILSLAFLSGKRSVLLAILSATLLKLIRDLISLRLSWKLSFTIVLASGLALFAFSLNLDFFERLLQKFSFSDGDLNFLSAGRIAEVISAFSPWLESPFAQVFGFGFGDTYLILPDDPNGDVSLIQNIHFSYGNSVLVFGVAGVLLLHVGILVKIWETTRCIRFSAAGMQLQHYTLIAHLVLATFSLTLYADPIFWMLLAYGRVSKKRLSNWY